MAKKKQKRKKQFPGYSLERPGIEFDEARRTSGRMPFYKPKKLDYGEELARLTSLGMPFDRDSDFQNQWYGQTFGGPDRMNWDQSGILRDRQPYTGSFTGARSIEGGLSRLFGDPTWLPAPPFPPQLPMPPNPEFYNPLFSSYENMNEPRWGR